MKTARKILSGVVVFVMILTGNTFAHTMYSLDGRNIEVNYNDAQNWRNVGWYDEPVQMMYAPDGRTEIIYKSQVSAWKNVGWYEVPVQIMYAPDGRTAVVDRNQADAWRNVGWYDEPVQMMYAPDGRTEVIYKSQVSAWQKVGWHTYPVRKISGYKNEYAYVLKQKLEEEYSTEKSFSLVYIDGDYIPELIYRYSECHAVGAEVFTFSDGRAVSLGIFGEFGDIYYYPYANRFTAQYWGMGGEYISLYEISGSSAKELVELNGYVDYLHGKISDFNVNGVPVSNSSYINTRKSYGLGEEYGSITYPYRRSMDTNKYPLTEYNVSVALS